jgi:hypothetical protein
VRHKHLIALTALAFAGVAAPAGAADTGVSPTKCYQQSFGEFGTRYCVSTDSSCVFGVYRWGGVEGEYTCYVQRP